MATNCFYIVTRYPHPRPRIFRAYNAQLLLPMSTKPSYSYLAAHWVPIFCSSKASYLFGNK